LISGHPSSTSHQAESTEDIMKPYWNEVN